MTTATLTKHLLTVAKAPDSRGTFEGEIEHNPEHGDKDGERIASFTNVPGTFPLLYQHTYGDPGSEIGTVHVLPKGDDRHLIVLGRLDLSKPMAEAIYARMLLPSDDSMALSRPRSPTSRRTARPTSRRTPRPARCGSTSTRHTRRSEPGSTSTHSPT